MSAASSIRSHHCETPREELANCLTHCLGIALSIVALVFMIFAAKSDPVRLASVSIFGTTLILLYASSTLYHSLSGHRAKAFFRWLDHACIYLLIAGSYTPLTLVTLSGPRGWTLLGVVWFLALTGVILKAVLTRRKDHWISTLLYVVMGWLVLLVMGPLTKLLPSAGIWWLVAGGFSYTFGTLFYAWKKLPFNHAIWHLFVLGGSACHVVAVVVYILR
jgi:hemolysin III